MEKILKYIEIKIEVFEKSLKEIRNDMDMHIFFISNPKTLEAAEDYLEVLNTETVRYIAIKNKLAILKQIYATICKHLKMETPKDYEPFLDI